MANADMPARTMADALRASTPARAAMLRSIREALAASPPDQHPATLAETTGTRPRAAGAAGTTDRATVNEPRVSAFIDAVIAAGATCTRVANAPAAVAAVQSRLRTYASEAGITRPLRIGYSDAAHLRDIAAGLRDSDPAPTHLQGVAAISKAQLFALDVGITGVQWGVIETGTLVLSTANERNRALSLTPAVHIAVVRRQDLRETLSDVFREIGTDIPGPLPPDPSTATPHRAVTLITGPSRTSDIELTLVIGVHGPRQLHVLFLDDSSPSTP